jgi:3-dehydroquinate synthase
VQKIPVKTRTASYNVYTGNNLLAKLRSRIQKDLDRNPQRFFVLTSPEIWALWSTAFLAPFKGIDEPTILFLPSGEIHKRLDEIERLASELASAGADRTSLLIAFGGGIVGDLGGFLAAVYMRGIDYVQVPTTLLAQVDSSVGGKTGVNLPRGKNLVGSFHHPRAVYADIQTLATLPDRELRAGLYESLKAGIIRDAKLFDYMERNAAEILGRKTKSLERVIAASIQMKAEIVGKDERESGLRMLLNYGHTVGHAIESATGYDQLLHGEAVAWGMLAALNISVARKAISTKDALRIEHAIHLYGPLRELDISAEQLIASSASDKKNSAGVRRFVLPLSIGKARVFENVTDTEMISAIENTLANAGEYASYYKTE